MQALLSIIKGEGSPRICELDPAKPITVGRSRDNTMILHDERSSRLHCRIYNENGLWILVDNKTLNGTRIGTSRVIEPLVLHDGMEFDIADTRLRFNIPGSDLANTVMAAAATAKQTTNEISTIWDADELAVLHGFMTKAAETNEPREVILNALQTVLRQTRADVTGFIGLDEDNNPLPRLILPETASVDAVLSKQLIQSVKQEGKTIWLAGADEGEIDQSDSLMPFDDAVCVPLRAEGAPFGALHVYRSTQAFGEREVRFCELIASHLANVLARLRQFRSLEAENVRLKRRAPVSTELIGDSPSIVHLKQLIGKAAACPSTVLIQGETGSGKELVAHALHQHSDRHRGPFVVANCGAIAPTLLEAELFGFVPGAFTGADRYHQGYFEQADEGTLFLDEIGDMSLDCQVKVLRVLEAKTIRPVGGKSEVKVDVRVVAASHKDLAREMSAGRFRQDLFYRLRVICLTVPPLRDHLDDLPVLVEKFLDKFAADAGRRKRLTPAAMRRMREYAWPGNVRELRTVLESAVMLTDAAEIDVDDLWLQGATGADQPVSLKLEDVELWAIREALKRQKGNISAAARTLDISRETLAQKIKKYNISREEA
ncbi:MAG TPA: sigma 54-interacting transcriptional regulator [Gemmataceae bacterium]|nr:sigma 54-interacting transcriptional regulator [Gemmataceae bacterium]